MFIHDVIGESIMNKRARVLVQESELAKSKVSELGLEDRSSEL